MGITAAQRTALLLLITAGGGCKSQPAEAVESSCGLPQKMRNLSLTLPSEASAERGQRGIVEVSLSSPLTATSDPPVLHLSLRGAGLGPGTYEMAASDADPLSCAFCATVVGPIRNDTNRPAYIYAASAGTLRLDEVGKHVRGELRGMAFREVRYSRTEKRYVNGRQSCQAQVARVRFGASLDHYAAL